MLPAFAGGERWINEPKTWRAGPDGLMVVTDSATDFWRETHYGFVRHSGHVFAADVPNGFTATVRVRTRFGHLYDQAGLMVLVDEVSWVKFGLEWSDGAAQLGSVLTIGRSDWATGPFAGDPGDFWLRATVNAGVLRLQASADGVRWPLSRLCPFPAAPLYRVGPMCCTPERGGLEVLFSDFAVGPASRADLHDLS